MSVNRWFVVTNTENLEFFFHCGLIVDRQGFSGNAYIADAMQERPDGYIPCFPQTNLWDALKAAKAEDDNLTECLLELDIKQFDSPAFYRTEELDKGRYNPFHIKNEIPSDTQVLSEILLPAPLPLSCIKNIILKDSKAQKSLVAKYELAYGTTRKKFITTAKKTEKFFEQFKPKQADNTLSLESENNSTNPPPIGEHIPSRLLNYKKAFSYGGALSLLYYQTKNGQKSTQIFKDFSANDAEPEPLNNIATLLAFFFNPTDDLDESVQLYSQVINCISGQTDVGVARYKVLQLLNDKERLPSGYSRDCGGLANSLTQLVDRTHTDDSDTIFTKLIEHYEAKEPGRSKIFILMTMFFVRDNSETMLKYYHSIFKEEDYSLLALFFGAVNGFINTPQIIRGVHDLSTWISFKMATYMHGKDSLTHFFSPHQPILIYDKCFKQKDTDKKLTNFCKKFGNEVGIPISKFVKWSMRSKDHIYKNGEWEFDTEPKITAKVLFDQLEEFMLLKTIKEANDLFDFNPVIDAYK